MPTPLPRKPFQIHLSTAIVMMFFSAVLIYINSIPTTRLGSEGIVADPDFLNDHSHFQRFRITSQKYGWPRSALVIVKSVFSINMEVVGTYHRLDDANYPLIAIDLGVALGVLVVVWILNEGLIRRSAQTEA